MNIHRLRSFLFLLSADNPGGGGSSAPEEPKTLAEASAQLATARTEHATLTETHATLAGQLTTAETRATTAESDRASLQVQFTTLNESVEAIRTERDQARTEAATLRTEKEQLETTQTKQLATIQNLEALCGVKGIDPKTAVKSGGDNPQSAKGTAEELRAEYAKITDSKQRATFYAKHRDAMLD